MLIIKNGLLIDPLSGLEGKRDIIIENGIVKDIIESGKKDFDDCQMIDAEGLTVIPGLVDCHVHFRDPGFTYKEDILTGAAAAAKGGFTTVVMMGNTSPHMDTCNTIQYALEKGKRTGINVLTCGNITQNMEGHELTNMAELKKAGAALFSDDGKPILSQELMEKACIEAGRLNMVLSLHEEDPEYISENGINSGEAAGRLGLKGADRQAEITMVERDIAIAKKTHAQITIQHISTAESVEMIRQARQEYDGIHAEATPNHFTLTQDAIASFGTMAKINPPLRTKADRAAILKGIADGTIEMIATDHAPHSDKEKALEFCKAPSGIIGLETALSLGLRELVDTGIITFKTLIERMTIGPSRVYGLDAGSISKGRSADLVLLQPAESTKYDCTLSKSSNSPFRNSTLPGRIYVTIANGRIVYRTGKAYARCCNI